MITYWDLFKIIFFYIVYFGIPLAAVVLSVVYVILRKKSVKLGLSDIVVQESPGIRLVRVCVVIAPAVFLAAEVIFLIRESQMSAMYLGVPFTDNVIVYVLNRVIYAAFICVMFLMIRLVFIQRKKLALYKTKDSADENKRSR